MNYTKNIHSYTSSNENSTITYYTYTPKTEIKGLLQISHGMCEYLERYEHFIDFLTEKGFLVFGNDHLGHKGSVENDDELGHFPHGANEKTLVHDIVALSTTMKEEYPNLPLFLMGHSMGSFIARLAYAEFSSLYNGLIICGTGYKIQQQLYRVAKIILKTTAVFKSKTYRSPALDKLFFGEFNKSIQQATTEQDWICANPETIEQYRQDKYCMFSFSASALHTLLTLCQKANSSKCFSMFPKDQPILIISGQEDYLGRNGKGIDSIEKQFNKRKLEDVKKIIYPHMRHEILNEIDNQIVYDDILRWLNHALSVYNNELDEYIADEELQTTIIESKPITESYIADVEIDSIESNIDLVEAEESKIIEEAAKQAIEEVVEEAIEEVAEQAVEEAVEEVAEQVVEEAVEEIAEQAVEEAVEEIAEQVVEEAIEEVAEQVVEEAVEEVAEQAVEEVTKQVVKEEKAKKKNKKEKKKKQKKASKFEKADIEFTAEATKNIDDEEASSAYQSVEDLLDDLAHLESMIDAELDDEDDE